MQESHVGLYLPGLPHGHDGLGGGETALLHEEGRDDGGGARVAEQAVDENLTAGKAQTAVDEFHGWVERRNGR